jgi:hypothetical protein
MTTRTALRITAWSSAGLALFIAGLALGQHPAPMDYKGVEESVLAAIDLAKEIDSVENRELRVSRATVAPGGHIGLHSHRGDPTIVYVLAGILTNHQYNGTTEEFYCLHVTLARRLHALAPGLTPRSVLKKFAAMQMIDVHLPTTDGRELVLTRYTEPEPELSLLLKKLKLELPAQPPPKITAGPVPPIPL